MVLSFHLSLFFLITWRMTGNNVLSTTCGKNKPVVKICTEASLEARSTIYIDTSGIPRFQRSLCKCLIDATTSNVNISLSFVDDMVPETLMFQIDNNELTPGNVTNITVDQGKMLNVQVNKNYSTGGACLIVSSGSLFNVTCTTADSTDSTEIDINKDDVTIIIPVVVSIAAVICLVIVILLVIFCKRRFAKRNRQPEITNSDTDVTKKEEDDDYYMTENPMYQRDDNQNSKDISDNEYHYVENDNENSQIKHSQKQKLNEGNHYEYSTCLSSSKKGSSPNEKKTAKLVEGNANMPVNENTYDTTSPSSVHQFQGLNEYHHLGTVGKVSAVDTYNTMGNAGRPTSDDDQEGFSEYQVTNVRS